MRAFMAPNPQSPIRTVRDADLDSPPHIVIGWSIETRFEIVHMGREMVRAPILAAGGIVLRQQETPLIAVVRLRKRNEWVLPKGKLDDGETPRIAAEREAIEETGRAVFVHEFLGTLVYESGGRSKVVHYWRMEADGEQVYDLMDDVKAVDWLPLDAAVERLSRGYERAFLANVGPLALEAAQPRARRPSTRPPVLEKRRSRQAVLPEPAIPASDPQPDLISPAAGRDQHPDVANRQVEARLAVPEAEVGIAAPPSDQIVTTAGGGRAGVVQIVRDWLRRANLTRSNGSDRRYP
jgi:8-oxo-dGTP diphosphatase